MPQDKHGRELRKGDVVTVTCVVTAVNSPMVGEKFQNVTLDTVEDHYPFTRVRNKDGSTYIPKTSIALNGRQTEKVVDDPPPPAPAP